jgi:uncharacterized protein YkwD
MISVTAWRAAALAPLAFAFLATAAPAQGGAGRMQLRIAAHGGGEPVAELVLGTHAGAPTALLRIAPHACAGAEAPPSAKAPEIARAATLCLLNAERARRGLLPLHERQPLTEASQAYAERMVAERFFAHEDPVGYLLDGTWIAGQNLAWAEGPLSVPYRIVEGWMGSPEHKRNILRPDFGEIGIGIAPGSPEPRSRLSAATYTTDFGIAAPRPGAIVPAKRKPCGAGRRAGGRTKGGARRVRTRCARPPGRRPPTALAAIRM